MTASAENMFLSEKSLHFDLNCKNKEFPTHPPHSHRRSNHNTHSFLCVCSRSIISHIAEKKQSCDVASGKKLILFPPAVIQLDPPATDHTEHLARAANAVKPSGSQGAENTYSLLQRSRWVADTVQRGYSVRCQLQLIMSPFMHLGERQRWIHCVAGSSQSWERTWIYLVLLLSPVVLFHWHSASRLHDEDQRVNSTGARVNNLELAWKSWKNASSSGCYDFSGELLGLTGVVPLFWETHLLAYLWF